MSKITQRRREAALLYRAGISAIERELEKRDNLRALALIGLEVVDDFMPNIGKCALQDYGRLNYFCIAARAEKGK